MLRLEMPAVLTRDGATSLIDATPAAAGVLVELLWTGVEAVSAMNEGRLVVHVRDGAVLEVPAGGAFEAWEIAGPHGLRIVSVPGGSLAVWRGHGLG